MGSADHQQFAKFATTHWSVVMQASNSTEDGKQALNELAQRYWYPLYAFCRRRGNDHHDAQDLTQGFFTHLLNDDRRLESVSPEKGRFRTFLMTAFKNFMSNQHRNQHTIRRGGAVQTVSLDSEAIHARYALESERGETPEQLFERSWATVLLAGVDQRLAQDYQRAGKEELFRLLEPHLKHRDDAVPREEIGRRLQLSPAAVNMSIYRMRRRYGEILREEVAATVDDPVDVDDELRALMAAVSSAS